MYATLRGLSFTAFLTLLLSAGCTFDQAPSTNGSPALEKRPGWMPQGNLKTPDEIMDAAARDATSPMRNAAMTSTPAAMRAMPADDGNDDAGTQDASVGVAQQPPAMTAGRPASPPTNTAPAGVTTKPGCGRQELQELADAFLLALSGGSSQTLDLDPNLRYTENGEVVTLGFGLWLSAPRRDYARHFVDESQCGSLTVAVLSELASQLVIAIRLGYRAGRLSEVETVFVRPNSSWFSPEGIYAGGPDPWLQPVEMPARMTREDLIDLAQNYFGSTIEASLLPAHAPSCSVRQNGAPAGVSCGDVPGTEPYMQLRYLVIDESVGIVSTVAWRNSFLSVYVFKAQSDTVQSIEAIGGMRTAKSGW